MNHPTPKTLPRGEIDFDTMSEADREAFAGAAEWIDATRAQWAARIEAENGLANAVQAAKDGSRKSR